MKRSKAETAQTRRRILDAAAQAFKSNGIQGTGVAEIMAAAGLTHGGFYRHFASKDQLVAEMCAVSMDIFVDAAGTAAGMSHESFLEYIEHTLSAEYRDDTLGGCPLVAMGSELVRADAATRRAASQGFEDIVNVIAKWMPFEDPSAARVDAIFTLVSMIGAVTMSRIIDNPELSNQILDVTKKRLASLRAKARSAAKQHPVSPPESSQRRIKQRPARPGSKIQSKRTSAKSANADD
ncbi:MAG: TetR/AcrR family transcriptional regulator [Nitrosospira sp.]